MESRLLSTFFGALLGLSLSLLVYVILFEHPIFFFILPIFPIVGVGIGVFLGVRKKLPAMKIYLSLAIFTAIFALSVACMKTREIFLQAQRESLAISMADLSPNSNIMKVVYEVGNGMEVPPNVKVYMSSKVELSEVFDHYDTLIEKNGPKQWQGMSGDTKGKWRNKNFVLYINKGKGPDDYIITMDFYGLWIAQIFVIESLRKELLSFSLRS